MGRSWENRESSLKKNCCRKQNQSEKAAESLRRKMRKTMNKILESTVQKLKPIFKQEVDSGEGGTTGSNFINSFHSFPNDKLNHK